MCFGAQLRRTAVRLTATVVVHCPSDVTKPALAAPFDCASCFVLLLLRRLVLIGLAVLLLVLLTRLLILLGSLAGLQGIRGLVWLGGSNVDSGHRISFAIQPGNISGQACKLCS